MGTFLAGLRSRRWLNVGVFALGVLAMLVAVATPLYARSSAEHLLDQRVDQRPVYETGLNVETVPQYAVGRSTVDPANYLAAGPGARPKPLPPLTDEAREQMLAATHTEWAPWTLVDFNDQSVGRLTLLRDLLDRLPDTELPTPDLDWPDLIHEPRKEKYGVLEPIGNYPVSAG